MYLHSYVVKRMIGHCLGLVVVIVISNAYIKQNKMQAPKCRHDIRPSLPAADPGFSKGGQRGLGTEPLVGSQEDFAPEADSFCTLLYKRGQM